MIVTQVLYSGLGEHGSVAFSLFEGDVQYKVQHKMVFFGIEPVKEEYKKKCEQNQIEYQGVLLGRGLVAKIKAMLQAFSAIVKQKPSVVVLHSVSLYMLVPVLRLFGIKVISVDHTTNTLKTKSDWIEIKRLRRFSDFQVYLTKIQYDDYKDVYGESFHKIGNPIIINNGIDTNKYIPKRAKQIEDSYKLIMLGRFTSIKDFQSLIKAVEVIKRRKLYDFKVFLAGDGETLQECKELTRKIGVENEVVFTGMLDEKSIIQNLQDSYLYVHSSFGENMSTAIMQAMSCGLPCLVSDVPGNKAIIRDGENGWLFKTGDAEDLAKKIDVLMALPQQVNQMSIVSRTYAVDHFGMQKMFESYYKLMQ